MEQPGNVMDMRNLHKSEEFLKEYFGIASVDTFLHGILKQWSHEWNDFNDIAIDICENVNTACEMLMAKHQDGNLRDLLQVSIECVILNKLHDYIVPLIYYQHEEEDNNLFEKCRQLSDEKITAEQLGAPEDYAIPLYAAVVELASLDNRKSPVEKIHCLCTTYDLVFAELKSAIVEIISRSSDKDDEIPIIENCDIIPVLMTVIVRAKVLHLNSHIYYIENFLWKLKESENVMTTISVFKSTIDKIISLTEENLHPGSEKICRELDLKRVIEMMAELEAKRHREENNITLVDQHVERVSSLIYASTYANIT